MTYNAFSGALNPAKSQSVESHLSFNHLSVFQVNVGHLFPPHFSCLASSSRESLWICDTSF